MALGIDLKPIIGAMTASVEATKELAAALNRQAAAQERANDLASIDRGWQTASQVDAVLKQFQELAVTGK